MTYEEAQKWLNRGYRVRARIKAKKVRIENWYALAMSITSAMKDVAVASSMPSRKVEKYVVAVADMERRIQREIEELQRVETEISQAIAELVDNPTYAAILEMRYTSYMKWEQIAAELNYTLRWTMTMHERAIRHFSEKKAL